MPTHTFGSVSVHTFPAPPEGFDPALASDDDLKSYGFPARPDAGTEPRAAARRNPPSRPAGPYRGGR